MFIRDFGMDTITLAGTLPGKLQAIREAGFAQVMLSARDLTGHAGGVDEADIFLLLLLRCLYQEYLRLLRGVRCLRLLLRLLESGVSRMTRPMHPGLPTKSVDCRIPFASIWYYFPLGTILISGSTFHFCTLLVCCFQPTQTGATQSIDRRKSKRGRDRTFAEVNR